MKTIKSIFVTFLVILTQTVSAQTYSDTIMNISGLRIPVHKIEKITFNYQHDHTNDSINTNPEQPSFAYNINEVYDIMKALYVGKTSNHNDFGVAALMMLLESEGQDWIGPNTGYNWFNYSDFYARNYNAVVCQMMWNVYYKIIKACNYVCASIPQDTNDNILKADLGQARAVRAYCYMTLAQLYQFTYVAGNQDKPCVPIIHENMSIAEQKNNPRASVQAVYDFVMADLSYAIIALEGWQRSDKGAADQAVVYGLRARTNMLLGNYAEAAKDAAMAIKLSGAQSYTMAEVSKPTFCHAEANSVIWANMIVESDDIVQSGIVNWPSHMSSLFTIGYTGVGCYRSISSELYDKIPATDVRKGWWLDEDLESPLLDHPAYAGWKGNGIPYANVKFGVPDDDMINLVADADWTMMRYEEMLFIQAEGLARSGNEAAAQALLEDWVKTNRDPFYICPANDLTTLIDEIWMQRRIELWGEGFAWFDLNRLQKPIIRTNSINWPEAWVVDVPADHDCRIWTIPEVEINLNEGIDPEDNNPIGNPF